MSYSQTHITAHRHAQEHSLKTPFLSSSLYISLFKADREGAECRQLFVTSQSHRNTHKVTGNTHKRHTRYSQSPIKVITAFLYGERKKVGVWQFLNLNHCYVNEKVARFLPGRCHAVKAFYELPAASNLGYIWGGPHVVFRF